MYFADRTRYIILALSLACLTLIFSNSLALNFTIICMDDVKSTGCILGTIPNSLLIQHFGLRATVAVNGLLTTAATLFFPFAVKLGFAAVFIMRVLQGVGTALSFPMTGIAPAQWSTLKATGTFIAILSCHLQFCNILTMPLSGFLCESSWGWRAVFYVQGLLSALLFLSFHVFYTNNPTKHKHVSPKELAKITFGKSYEKKQKIPYRAIFTDSCILSIWLSAAGGNLAFQVFVLYGPTYINKVLHLSIASTGFATALPHILSAVAKFAVGPISDKATCISGKWRFIFFAALSQGIMAICIVVLANAKEARLAQAIYTAAIVFSGINVVGVVKCAQVVASQYSHFAMSIIAFLTAFNILITPVAVNFVCPDNDPAQWSRLFIGLSVVVVLANAPFVFFARDEAAEWTDNKVHAALEHKDTGKNGDLIEKF
ncbi:unnamed protein product [Cylicocyclus nassatus]|uniref:Major facilitator superfamily (MFS) profile domain-containing protein n=1 Tax=Cylicocyclus nassatus TaxID=53992 RepID=A0AA36DSW3_CYLNA|nr:unnamed protein product [Cylicocyclus nassatus]